MQTKAKFLFLFFIFIFIFIFLKLIKIAYIDGKFFTSKFKFSKGDVVSIKLDFEQSTPNISFKNGKQEWNHPLQKNTKYYPSISIWKQDQYAILIEN